ncbi:Serine/threonine-protein kinase PBS1 [Heracleum sosnowskyi]|uniref:Serine/threonine-protein kinase PBS1 n=1 Tax=Heracleum sosnowskyi TaxID=360622 RepID=A0AAD8LZD3_9APIA|nr:Serine/threonine-protein kinase PBS1 [Heracleum sosnowskyi]
MGLMVQFIYLVLKGFAILLLLEESAGSSIAPSPSQVIFDSIFSTREETLHPVPRKQSRTAGSPIFQPNVPLLNQAPARTSSEFLVPSSSPINHILPPNNLAAPAKNVRSIVPSLSFSTSQEKPSHVEGPMFQPGFMLKGDGKPIAAPSIGTPKQVSPLDSPTKAFPKGSSVAPQPLLKMKSSPASADKEPYVTPVSTRPPRFDWKMVEMPVSAPSEGTLKLSSPLDHSSSEGSHSPAPLLSTSFYRHPHAIKSVTSPVPSTDKVTTPSPGVDWKTNEIVVAVPSNGSPKKLSPQGHTPVKESPLSHASPPRASRSQQMTLPLFPPWNSPSASSSPKNPNVPHLPHSKVLPPLPPNEDCESVSCREPLTSNPPGSPCGCVLAMKAGLQLGLPLYAFFPLVSDLSAQISRGIFMKQSQVRIMGANADSQNEEKTVVLLDLVPLGAKFDNSTAYLIYQKFYQKELTIEPYYFGNYEVLYLHYPGLPASPPAPSTFGNEAYSGLGSKRRPLKPLGVDVSRQQHKKGLKRSVVAIIVLLASLSLTLCCAVAWVLLFRHRRRNTRPELNPTIPMSSLAKSPASKIGSGLPSVPPSYKTGLSPYTGTAKTFNATDIERATDSFDASRIIGEGGFGIVYSGVLDDGTKVAVKVLKRDNQQGGREFLAEVEMLSRLHHRNLVKLVGICMEEHSRCLVYELIANGSVESHLHGVDKVDAPLDWNARLMVALGAARGLAYLHEDSSPRVIHRDFKSSNILLEHDFTPKVSDFGLARTGSDEENKHISTRVMGTFGYVAPEYAMTGHLLVKSDVYSYGVVLLELLTGRKPVDMSRPSGQENLVTWARPLLTSKEGLELMFDQSLKPDFPFESFAEVAAVASMCVEPEVSDRPFMSEVVQALKLICNEFYTKNNFGSRICSPEHIFDGRPRTTSGYMSYHSQSPFSDVEWGLRASEVFSASERFERMDLRSLRRHSSTGPFKSRRILPLISRTRGWSGGSTSEQRAFLGLWSRSL